MAVSLGRILDMLKRRPYSVVALLFFLAMAIPFCTRQRDWTPVYLAAGRHLLAGEDIFQHGYVYPPLAAWLAAPFTLLPPLAGMAAWYAVNVVAMIVLFCGAWRLSGGSKLENNPGVPRREHLILLLGLLCGVYYALDALGNQQTDLVVAALSIAGCLFLERGRGVVAALWFGLAAGLKCTPLLWAPYLAWRRRWVPAGLVVIVALAVNLLPDLALPAPGGQWRLAAWAERYIIPMNSKDYAPGTWASAIQFNHSFAGIGNRWALNVWSRPDGRLQVTARQEHVDLRQLKLLVYSASAFLLLAGLYSSGRKRVYAREETANLPRRTVLEYGLVFVAMLMLSPMSSKPHFCTLILPGFCLARIVVERRQIVPVICLFAAIACGLCSNKDLVGGAAYDVALWYGSVALNALLLFAGSCYFLRRFGQLKEAPGSIDLPQSTRAAA